MQEPANQSESSFPPPRRHKRATGDGPAEPRKVSPQQRGIFRRFCAAETPQPTNESDYSSLPRRWCRRVLGSVPWDPWICMERVHHRRRFHLPRRRLVTVALFGLAAALVVSFWLDVPRMGFFAGPAEILCRRTKRRIFRCKDYCSSRSFRRFRPRRFVRTAQEGTRLGSDHPPRWWQRYRFYYRAGACGHSVSCCVKRKDRNGCL